jgi:hypothetical protein
MILNEVDGHAEKIIELFKLAHEIKKSYPKSL